MKDFLEKLIANKRKQYEGLQRKSDESNDLAEVRAIGETLKQIALEIAEAEKQLAELDKPAEGGDGEGEGERKLDILATVRSNTAKGEARKADKYDTEEYRTAFMNFVCRGAEMPAEYRENQLTNAAAASAVIPTTIINEMVVEMKTYGRLYERVRKLTVQGGVQIPVISLKPSATWITADAKTSESDEQKIQANTSVTFNYYGLECKISQSLLVSVTTLEIFQQMFVTLAVEAMAKALDIAIIKGSGSGEPLGITVDSRVPAAQIVTMPQADVSSWSAWKKKVFAKIPAAYRNGSFIMAQGTFDGYIDGMVDNVGQPIGRVNYGIDNAETYRFGGKEVITVEPDVIKDWDSATGHASTGDVVAVFVNLNDYGFNSNLEMKTVKWIDNNTNEVKNKVILIADGKLIDPNGVVIVKKGAAASA